MVWLVFDFRLFCYLLILKVLNCSVWWVSFVYDVCFVVGFGIALVVVFPLCLRVCGLSCLDCLFGVFGFGYD